MSPRKNQKFLSEQEKNDLIEEYKHTPISQQKLAEKFDVSKTQVQKVIDHSGAIKMVKRVKKTPNKEQDVDFMSRRAMVRQDIQEFNSFSELAHFADVGKTTDLVFQTHRGTAFDGENSTSIMSSSDQSLLLDSNEDDSIDKGTGQNASETTNPPVDGDANFLNHVQWYVKWKNDELFSLRQKYDQMEKELALEKEIKESTIGNLNDCLSKVKRLTADNESLEKKLNEEKRKNKMCIQCEKEAKIKFRKLHFCDKSCIRKTIADINAADHSED